MDDEDKTFYGSDYKNSWEIINNSPDKYFLHLKNKDEMEFRVVDYDKDGDMEFIAAFHIEKVRIGIYNLYDYREKHIGRIVVHSFEKVYLTSDFTTYELKRYLGDKNEN
jgi:hypothetical protein